MSPVRLIQHTYTHQLPVLVKELISVTIDPDKDI